MSDLLDAWVSAAKAIEHLLELSNVQKLHQPRDACEPNELEHDTVAEHDLKGKNSHKVDDEPSRKVVFVDLVEFPDDELRVSIAVSLKER